MHNDSNCGLTSATCCESFLSFSVCRVRWIERNFKASSRGKAEPQETATTRKDVATSVSPGHVSHGGETVGKASASAGHVRLWALSHHMHCMFHSGSYGYVKAQDLALCLHVVLSTITWEVLSKCPWPPGSPALCGIQAHDSPLPRLCTVKP